MAEGAANWKSRGVRHALILRTRFEIHWISTGFPDLKLDLWISHWICGFVIGFVDLSLDLRICHWICGFVIGFVDLSLDLWILHWICGFYIGFLDFTHWISDFLHSHNQRFTIQGPPQSGGILRCRQRRVQIPGC